MHLGTMSEVAERVPGIRIPLLDTADMSSEQLLIHDEIVEGRRGKLVGPLRAAILVPELARHWSRMGEFLRYRTRLPSRYTELAILVVGRRWAAALEWSIHAEAARAAGLSDLTIETIRTGGRPSFADPAELEVYEFARSLQQTGRVPDDYYAAVKARWSVEGAVELTAVIGYYTMVAITLNAHRFPAPDGSTPFVDEPGLLEVLSALPIGEAAGPGEAPQQRTELDQEEGI